MQESSTGINTNLYIILDRAQLDSFNFLKFLIRWYKSFYVHHSHLCSRARTFPFSVVLFPFPLTCLPISSVPLSFLMQRSQRGDVLHKIVEFLSLHPTIILIQYVYPTSRMSFHFPSEILTDMLWRPPQIF